MCVLRVLHYIQFYLSGCSSRERGRSVLLLCSVSSRYHPTISVLLLTPRCKDTSSVVLHVFLCHYCFVVRPVARASLRSRGTTVFPFWPPFPTPLHHSALITPPTRFSEIFTRTNTYTHTQSSHLLPTHPRLYHQQQMSNEKKNPLSRRRCVRLGLQR
ncbi:hypothetical protein BGY98DRAFT_538897 [Russula aff. rugulosa BPL654]|nr:hypothetical protein BGY98DRAFT_538897 [Russula aff. rugulosa BPL654]